MLHRRDDVYAVLQRADDQLLSGRQRTQPHLPHHTPQSYKQRMYFAGSYLHNQAARMPHHSLSLAHAEAARRWFGAAQELTELSQARTPVLSASAGQNLVQTTHTAEHAATSGA